MFLLPLAYSPFNYDSFVLPKLLLARMLVGVLLVLFVARIAASHTLVVKRTPLDLPIVAFLASAALSSMFAENQNVALFGTYARYDGLLTMFTFAALFWLSVQGLADQAEARVLIRVLLASGYVVAATAILQSVHDSIQQRVIEPGAILPAFGSLGLRRRVTQPVRERGDTTGSSARPILRRAVHRRRHRHAGDPIDTVRAASPRAASSA